MRPARVLLLLLLVPFCRRPLHPHAAGAAVEVAVRVRPAGAAAEVIAWSATGPPVHLLPAGDGEFRGAVPGTAAVRVRALAQGGAQLGEVTGSVAASPGGPSQVLVAIDAQPPASPAPLIEWIAAPRTSVATGERVPLDARLALRGARSAEASWSVSPAGCGNFAEPGSPATTFTAAAPGTCTLSLRAAAPGAADTRTLAIVVRAGGLAYRYPLRPGAGGRYLVDQRGTPFLLKGEAAWLALVNLTGSEQEAYLADRAAKGFNLVEVMLLNHDYTSPPEPVPPANRHGEQPFLKAGELSSPADPYFDRAVAFVRRAAAHGIVVLVAPLYLGFDGGHEGWWQELNLPVNDRAACAGFGRYLGGRFKDLANLIWLAGGDFAPPAGSEGEARYLQIVEGIKAAGATQPWTGHWNLDHLGGISTDQARFAAAMDLNGVYQYADPYRYTGRAWAFSPPRPVFLLESAYEREHARSDLLPFRKAWWWAMLSGASGVIWGNNFLWMAETARGRHAATYAEGDGTISSWHAELESPGTWEMIHLHAFFEAIAWHRLAPAPEHALVTAGEGSRSARIVAAATPQHDLAVVYVPPDGAQRRSFSLDLSRMKGPLRAAWYDPSSGVYLPVSPPISPAPQVELETPGANASGVNDWVLRVESPG